MRKFTQSLYIVVKSDASYLNLRYGAMMYRVVQKLIQLRMFAVFAYKILQSDYHSSIFSHMYAF